MTGKTGRRMHHLHYVPSRDPLTREEIPGVSMFLCFSEDCSESLRGEVLKRVEGSLKVRPV